MPTKWLQERQDGSKNDVEMPPRRASRGLALISFGTRSFHGSRRREDRPSPRREGTLPHTLHPTTHTLHPPPYALHPTPYTPNPTPDTLHLTPYTPHSTPYTPHPTPCTLHTTPYTLRARCGGARVREQDPLRRASARCALSSSSSLLLSSLELSETHVYQP